MYRLDDIKNIAQAERINRNTSNLVNKLGFDSPIAQKAMQNIIDKVPQEYIKYKNGVPQIRKPATLGKNENIHLKELDENVPRYNDVKKEYEKQYKEYKEEREFYSREEMEEMPEVEFKEFINKKQKLKSTDFVSKIKYISGNPDDLSSDETEALQLMKQSNMSYDDLFHVMDILDI